MKCKKHPTYKAILPPKADCRDCRIIFNTKYIKTNGLKIKGFRYPKIEKVTIGKALLRTDMGKEAFKEMIINTEMLDRKHLDYGPGNISRFGLRGVVVRMNDKIERLATLTDEGQKKETQFESIEDTLRDLGNYATIGLLCMKGKWK